MPKIGECKIIITRWPDVDIKIKEKAAEFFGISIDKVEERHIITAKKLLNSGMTFK